MKHVQVLDERRCAHRYRAGLKEGFYGKWLEEHVGDSSIVQLLCWRQGYFGPFSMSCI